MSRQPDLEGAETAGLKQMISQGESFGKYKIERELGQGASGTVFLAHNSEDDSPVAIKLLHRKFANSPEYQEQLEREAKLCAKVDSPYVVDIVEFGSIDGNSYVAMEYVPGDDLRSSLGGFDFKGKTDISIAIGRGIQAAHQEGLVHRDLKPENIKLSKDGEPRILDFGLAHEIDTDSVDAYGNVEGTLYYLSPEQLSGESVSTGTDLFSWGVMLYELFSGRRPFEGEYSASIIYSILHEDPIAPSQINEELPPWIDELVMKLLAKRSEDRFQSAREAVIFMQSNKNVVAGTGERWVKKGQTATVVDLKNLSGDPSWEYFCEGFTEDVIRELSRRTNLVVSGQPSASHSRNIKETFDRCRSDYLIIGSLMKWQDQIKLNLSIYGEDGDRLVWDSSFSDKAENLFDLLGGAAKECSARLSAAASAPVVQVEEEFQPNVSAYDYYLKGKNYYQTNKPEDLDFALRMFSQALEIEPEFALAHSGLSDVYSFKYMAYYDRSHECIEKAKQHADSALAVDPYLPEGFRSLGRYYMFTRDSSKAEESFLKAIEFNPKYAIAYRTLGWLKAQESEFTDAYNYAKKALELAPTDLETHLLIGLIHTNVHKYSLAVSVLQRATELGPDYGRSYYELGTAYRKLGVHDLAIKNLELACKFEGDPNCFVDTGYIYLIIGNYDKSRAFFRRSIDEGCFPFVANYYLGWVELRSGSPDTAQEHFNKTIAELEGIDYTESEGANRHMQAFLALAYAMSAQKEKARITLLAIERFTIVNGELMCNMARCWNLLGESEKALTMLERAGNAYGGPSKKELRSDPHLTNLFVP